MLHAPSRESISSSPATSSTAFSQPYEYIVIQRSTTYMILPFILIALPLLEQCTLVGVDVRNACHANHCLRALRGNPTVASSFCSSYYTTSVKRIKSLYEKEMLINEGNRTVTATTIQASHSEGFSLLKGNVKKLIPWSRLLHMPEPQSL